MFFLACALGVVTAAFNAVNSNNFLGEGHRTKLARAPRPSLRVLLLRPRRAHGSHF